jgi:hypothetical protein
MTASLSLSVFHQWLLADPASRASACAIILHGGDEFVSDGLIQEIAIYLNEYDDDGDGRWLPATRELVAKITRDPSHRRLLGMEEFGGGRGRSEEDLQETIAALGRRGHVIFNAPVDRDVALDLPGAFHAGIGPANGISQACHVILNPELMGRMSLGHIVGDVFLEWLNKEIHRNPPIQDIR